MKTVTALVTATLLVGGVAYAAEHGGMGGGMMGKGMHGMMDMHRQMQTMDANGDGMLSKEEFVKTHETMFESMPKNQAGLVDMKDMSMCPMMAEPRTR